MNPENFSRRSFLALAAAAPALAAKKSKIPVGLELYSVRNELMKDLTGTVTRVAKMGYEGVEFYGPYTEWKPAYAQNVRKLLADVGMKCWSTHNGAGYFKPESLDRVIELNQILGSKLLVMSSAGRVNTIDEWKGVAERLNAAADKLKALSMRAGYHNHQLEFKPVEGQKPIEVLAKNTVKDVVLQLDVGTCVETGNDPVAWIKQNPRRIASMHCKEWSSKGKGYEVLFGQGDAPWKKIFKAAESVGGIEAYLIEQEGADVPPFEAAEKCLQLYRKMRG